MLVCIDLFSKYGWVTLATKSAKETGDAIEIILDKLGAPNAVCTDDGAECKVAFAKVMEKHNITHIITRTHATFVE